MGQYRMVCCDLDGTLLDNSGYVSEENLRAVCELKKSGIIFVPSTGRALSEIPDAVLNNNCIDYYITSNGSLIISKKDGVLFKIGIKTDLVSKIREVTAKYECFYALHIDGNCYVERSLLNESTMDSYSIGEGYRKVFRSTSLKIDGIVEKMLSEKMVDMVVLFLPTVDESERCSKELSLIEGIRVTASSDNCIEIIKENAGKGNGLYSLCDLLYIDSDSVIAVGDSKNDQSMLDAAGLSIAMSGKENLINADIVGPSNSDHIAEYILKKII